ncbi:hypothetical protein IGL98_000214 [Enterococcus sp. DIV0840]|uniref:T7SS effector LXG polymorphic toxin n=1 Tax=unclassified Enterococcus TaxID=2608891 RepID=UPI0030D38ECB
MGFYVDTAEMKKAVEEYQKLSKTAQSQLNTAKNAMNGIINSNAMSGKVGQAISADINNNQNAVIVGLKSSYLAVEMELRQAYQDFKGTTGETSDSAVLSEEVLTKAKSDIDKMKQTYQEQVKSFQSVYSSISDLISLSASKSDFNQVADATKKYADEIIQKVNQFDSKQGNSANEDMIQSLSTQIKAAQKVGGLGYTDPRFLAFANSTALADNVQAFQKKVTEADEKQRKTKEKDLNSMTPSEMIAKYGVDDPDVKKRINDINNGISYTALNKLKDGTEAISHSATANLLARETIASGKKIKNGTWHGSSVKSTKSGFKTWKQVNGDVNRFKAVKNAKHYDEVLNGTGKIGSGLKGLGYLGAAGAIFDGGTTFFERKDKYGTTSAAVDGTAHAASSVGAVYAGAAIGSLIPIPVVGTLVGAAAGFVVGNVLNSVWDELAHSKDNKFFSWGTLFGN